MHSPYFYDSQIIKKFKQYGYHIIANIGDNNCDLSTRNKTPNRHVMCFIIVSIIALMIINNIYTNYTGTILILVSSALTPFPSTNLAMLLGAATHSLNSSALNY